MNKRQRKKAAAKEPEAREPKHIEGGCSNFGCLLGCVVWMKEHLDSMEGIDWFGDAK